MTGARIRARLAREEAHTFVEMITTMAMLSFVMAAVAALFVSGLHQQTDMDQRFQAQQNARLALTSMRSDIRNSCVAPVVYSTPASVTPLASGVFGAKVTLASACSGGVATSNVTWCADSSTGAAPFGLYRQTGTTCAYNNGVKRADQLKTSAVFALSTTSGRRPMLALSFPVDANLNTTNGVYTLSDTVMARNSAATP
jgi:type II secretory pathway pseudopilin PulG